LKEVLDGEKVPPQEEVHPTSKSLRVAGGGTVTDNAIGSPGAIVAPGVSADTDGMATFPIRARKLRLKNIRWAAIFEGLLFLLIS
jgi:hypothetical protein